MAAGDADYALTSVPYLLAAQSEAAGCLAVRFIATAHQRNPTVGVVREDSGLRVPQDLPGTRAARWSMPWFTQEYAGALDYMGLWAPVIIDTPGDLDQALGCGDIDVIPTRIACPPRWSVGCAMRSLPATTSSWSSPSLASRHSVDAFPTSTSSTPRQLGAV